MSKKQENSTVSEQNTTLDNNNLAGKKRKASQDLETEVKNIENSDKSSKTNETLIPNSKKLNSNQLTKLLEIQMKKNEAINLNNKAVLDEEKQANDPEFLKRQKRERWETKKKELEEELKFKGIESNKLYLNQPALKYDGDFDNKKKKEVFGWNG